MTDGSPNSLAEELQSLRIDKSARGMSSSGLPGWVKGIVALALLGGAGWLAWSQVSDRLLLPEVTTTTVALVSPTQAEQLLVATGYVVPQRKANVSPRVGGRVAKIYVEDGTEVRQGQLLAELERADVQAQLGQAQANLQQAEARLLRSQVDLRDAQRSFDREQELQRKGVSSLAALEAATARLDSAKAQLEASRADVAAGRALVQLARVNLDNCFVRAPFAGRITQKLADVGEIVFGAVGGGAGGNGGIASLADFSTLMVEADVSESQVGKLKPGAPTEIALDAFAGRTFRGKVHEIRPKVDRAKATVTVKIQFLDLQPGDGVLPDMGAKVTFLAKELSGKEAKAAPTPAVRADAVASQGESKILWVVDSAGAVQSVDVILGPPIGGLVSLQRGPPAGTRIVERPPAELRAGMRVKEKQP